MVYINIYIVSNQQKKKEIDFISIGIDTWNGNRYRILTIGCACTTINREVFNLIRFGFLFEI